MTLLLLVEDETAVAGPLEKYLVMEGFQVIWAQDATTAHEAIKKNPFLAIVDWNLGGASGVDLVKEWRARGLQIPVIILTARHELADKVHGLSVADDYVVKPFEPRELLARIQARLRAHEGKKKSLMHLGIVLDDHAHLVFYKEAIVELTKMEFLLLKLFMENIGKAFSREELLNQVWGYQATSTTRTVDTHVLQLRQKLAPEIIETIHGLGYRMSK